MASSRYVYDKLMANEPAFKALTEQERQTAADDIANQRTTQEESPEPVQGGLSSIQRNQSLPSLSESISLPELSQPQQPQQQQVQPDNETNSIFMNGQKTVFGGDETAVKNVIDYDDTIDFVDKFNPLKEKGIAPEKAAVSAFAYGAIKNKIQNVSLKKLLQTGRETFKQRLKTLVPTATDNVVDNMTNNAFRRVAKGDVTLNDFFVEAGQTNSVNAPTMESVQVDASQGPSASTAREGKDIAEFIYKNVKADESDRKFASKNYYEYLMFQDENNLINENEKVKLDYINTKMDMSLDIADDNEYEISKKSLMNDIFNIIPEKSMQSFEYRGDVRESKIEQVSDNVEVKDEESLDTDQYFDVNNMDQYDDATIAQAMSVLGKRASSILGDFLPAKIGSTIKGKDVKLEDVGAIDKFIARNMKEGATTRTLTPEERKKVVIPLPYVDDITLGTVEDAAESLAFSLSNLLVTGSAALVGSAIGAGEGSLVSPGVGTAIGAGLGLVGGIASTKRQIENDFLRDMRARFLEANPGPITPELKEKWNKTKKLLDKHAEFRGWWEAGPETVGNLLTMGMFRLPVGKAIGAIPGLKSDTAKLIGSALIKTSFAQSTELLGETVTEVKQSEDDAKLGLIKKPLTYNEAFKRVAPGTIIQGLLSASGGKVTTELESKIKKYFPKKDKNKTNQTDNEKLDKLQAQEADRGVEVDLTEQTKPEVIAEDIDNLDALFAEAEATFEPAETETKPEVEPVVDKVQQKPVIEPIQEKIQSETKIESVKEDINVKEKPLVETVKDKVEPKKKEIIKPNEKQIKIINILKKTTSLFKQNFLSSTPEAIKKYIDSLKDSLMVGEELNIKNVGVNTDKLKTFMSNHIKKIIKKTGVSDGDINIIYKRLTDEINKAGNELVPIKNLLDNVIKKASNEIRTGTVQENINREASLSLKQNKKKLKYYQGEIDANLNRTKEYKKEIKEYKKRKENYKGQWDSSIKLRERFIKENKNRLVEYKEKIETFNKKIKELNIETGKIIGKTNFDIESKKEVEPVHETAISRAMKLAKEKKANKKPLVEAVKTKVEAKKQKTIITPQKQEVQPEAKIEPVKVKPTLKETVKQKVAVKKADKYTFDIPKDKFSIYKVNTPKGVKYAVKLPKELSQSFSDPFYDTIEIAEKEQTFEIEKEKRNIAFNKKQEIIKTEETIKKKEQENVDGFDKDMPKMRRGQVIKALNKMFNFDGKLMTRKEKVRELVNDNAKISVEEVDKIQPMTRLASNRANQREQDAHEQRIKDSGKKKIYYVGGYDLGKTAYDYANHLMEKKTSVGDMSEKNVTSKGNLIAGEYYGKNFPESFISKLKELLSGVLPKTPKKKEDKIIIPGLAKVIDIDVTPIKKKIKKSNNPIEEIIIPFADKTREKIQYSGVFFDKKNQRIQATNGGIFITVEADVKEGGIFEIDKNNKKLTGKKLNAEFPYASEIIDNSSNQKYKQMKTDDLLDKARGMSAVEKLLQNKDDVLAKIKQGDLELRINPNNLQKALETFKKLGIDEIEVSIKEAYEPMRIRDANNKKNIAFIMPIRNSFAKVTTSFDLNNPTGKQDTKLQAVDKDIDDTWNKLNKENNKRLGMNPLPSLKATVLTTKLVYNYAKKGMYIFEDIINDLKNKFGVVSEKIKNNIKNILSKSPIKTKSGTKIKRYKNIVGKEIGGKIYVHKKYADKVIPKQLLNNAKKILNESNPEFKYNAISYDKKTDTVRFDEAPDFNSATEPTIGNYISITQNKEVSKGSSNSIWHHKWLWVTDDYNGFNVYDSKNRSRYWLSKINGKASGSKTIFEQQLKANDENKENEIFTDTFSEQAGKTARPWKVTKTYKAALEIIKDGDNVLDYGSGPFQKVKSSVKSKGGKYFAFDRYGNIGDISFLKNKDVVMGSNVLNTAVYADNPTKAYHEALNEMASALKPNGTLVVNMPSSGPQATWMNSIGLENDLKNIFKNVKRKGEVVFASGLKEKSIRNINIDKEIENAWKEVKRAQGKILGGLVPMNAPLVKASVKLIKACFKKGIYKLQDITKSVLSRVTADKRNDYIKGLKQAMNQLIDDPNTDTSKVGMTKDEVNAYDPDKVVEPIKIDTKEIKKSEVKKTEKIETKPTGNIEDNRVFKSLENSRQLSKIKRKITAKKIFKSLKRNLIDESGNLKDKLLETPLGKKAVKYQELMAGATSKAELQIDKAHNDIYKDLTKKEKTNYLDTYVFAKRSIEILKRKPNFTVQANASIAELEALIDEIPDNVMKKIESKASIYWKTLDSQLNQLKEAGLITEKGIKRLKETGEYYSPREVLDYIDPDGTFYDGNGKITIPDSGIKKLTDEGSLRLVETDTAYLLTSVISRTQARISKNKANVALYEMAKSNPDNEIVTIAKKDEDLQPGFEKISVMIDGNKEQLIMPSDLAVEWVKSNPILNSFQAEVLSLATGTKILKTMATGINPEFVITNMPRDIAHIFLSTNEFSPTSPIAAAQMAKRLSEVFSDAIKRKGRYIDFINEGGGMGFLTHQGRIFERNINSEISKIQDVLGYSGETSEILTRLALREQALINIAKEKGVKISELSLEDREEATWIARGYLDFSQGGRMAKALNSGLPYINARIQGTRGIFRAFKERPVQTTYKAVQIGIVSSLLYMLNLGIDEDEYDKISPSDKRNYFNILVPNSDYKDKEGNSRKVYVKIAKDQGQRTISYIFEALTAKALGKEIDVNQIVETIKDLSPYIPSQDLPPFVDAFISYGSNIDFWRGQPIWKKEKVEAGAEQTSYTHPFFRAIGDKTNLSPNRLKVALEQVFTSGNIYTSAADLAWNKLFGKDKIDDTVIQNKILNFPFIRKFMKKTDSYNKYQKKIDEAKIKANTKKYRNTLKLDDMIQDYFNERKTKEEVNTFIENQETPLETKRLKRRFSDSEKLKDIPDRRWWFGIKELSPEIKAQQFWLRWSQSNDAEKKQLKETLDKFPGMKSKRFLKALNARTERDEKFEQASKKSGRIRTTRRRVKRR